MTESCVAGVPSQFAASLVVVSVLSCCAGSGKRRKDFREDGHFARVAKILRGSSGPGFYSDSLNNPLACLPHASDAYQTASHYVAVAHNISVSGSDYIGQVRRCKPKKREKAKFFWCLTRCENGPFSALNFTISQCILRYQWSMPYGRNIKNSGKIAENSRFRPSIDHICIA